MQYTTIALFALAGLASAQTPPNPINSTSPAGSDTAAPATYGHSSSAPASAGCDATYSNCQTAPNANQATCAANYAQCLGYNPFAPNGTNTAAPIQLGAPAAVTVVTDVVTAYTTYCPFATQVTQNGVVYTATASQTLTITNCPCTVTKSVSQQTGSMTSSSAPAKSTAATNGTSSTNGTTYKPVAYVPGTGAGNQLAAGGSLLAAAAAAIFLL